MDIRYITLNDFIKYFQYLINLWKNIRLLLMKYKIKMSGKEVQTPFQTLP